MLALKSMNKDYLALAMAKSLNELAHPAAKVKKATLLRFIIQKQMIQKAPLVKVVRVIKTRGWDRSV